MGGRRSPPVRCGTGISKALKESCLNCAHLSFANRSAFLVSLESLHRHTHDLLSQNQTRPVVVGACGGEEWAFLRHGGFTVLEARSPHWLRYCSVRWLNSGTVLHTVPITLQLRMFSVDLKSAPIEVS